MLAWEVEVRHLFCNRSEPSLGVGMELLQSGAAALGVLLQPSQIIYHQIIPNIYCVTYVIMFYGYYVEINVHGEEKKKIKQLFCSIEDNPELLFLPGERSES